MVLVDRLRRLLGRRRAAPPHPIGRASTAPPTASVANGDEQSAAGPDDRQPPTVTRGCRVGRYLVLEAIGSGGTANVFAAYDPELDRKVALKILRLSPARSAEAEARRLLREAQAAARLSHSNVVTVFDVGIAEGRPFVAMELVDGLPLGVWHRVAHRRWQERLRVVIAAGRGLAAAHEAGIVHRDFKPGNVIVSRDGRVLVVDFGLARDTLGDPAHTERRRAPVAGTPRYMAPEQRRGDPGDERSDQFAFCLTAWETLYGEAPPRDSQGEEHAAGNRLPTAHRWIPAAVRRALRRGLESSPSARYAELRPLLAALERALGQRRRRWVAAAATIALLGVSATGALVARQATAPEACAGAEQRLLGVWDPQIAADLGHGFSSLGDDAQQVWQQVERRLDRYASQWVRTYGEACEATYSRREQSGHVLDLQVACLDLARRELATVTDVLERPEPELIRGAVALAESLSPVDACADRRTLLAQPALPTEPSTARRVAELRSILAQAKALEAAGSYRQSMALASEALAAAEKTGYTPVEVDAHLRLAQLEGRVGRFPEMREHLVSVAEKGEATGYGQATGFAYSLLIIAELQSGDLEAARTWGRLSAGVVARLEDDGELASISQLFRGRLAEAEGRYEDAIAHHRRYLEHSRTASSTPRPVREAYARLNLGRQYLRLEQTSQAEGELARAVELFEESLGPSHRATAQALTQIGRLRQRQGDPDAAARLYRRALVALASSGEEQDWDTATALDGLGASLLEQHRFAEARAVLESSLQIRTTRPGRPAERAQTRFLLARALWPLGDQESSLALADAARGELTEESPLAGQTRAELDRWLAQRGGSG